MLRYLTLNVPQFDIVLVANALVVVAIVVVSLFNVILMFFY